MFRNVKPIPRESAEAALDQLAAGTGKLPPRGAISPIHPGPEDTKGWIGTVINRGASEDPNLSLGESILRMQKQSGSELFPTTGGFYDKNANTMVALKRMDPATVRRHESIHALVDQAAKTGNLEDLPLIMKIPAMLKSGAESGSFRSGLGKITDELAAQSLENRGILNQIRGGADFLFGRDPGYLPRFLKYNRPSGELFRALLNTGEFGRQAAGGATPLIAGALGLAGGAGLGTAGLYNYLQGE